MDTDIPFILLSPDADTDDNHFHAPTSRNPPPPPSADDYQTDKPTTAAGQPPHKPSGFPYPVAGIYHPTTPPPDYAPPPPPSHAKTPAQQLSERPHPHHTTTWPLSPPSLDPAGPAHTEDEYVRIHHARMGLDRTTTVTCKACGTQWEHGCDGGGGGSIIAAYCWQEAADGYGGGCTSSDRAKRTWYEEWLGDKGAEKRDPWGFSSTGVSRAVTPRPGAAGV